MSVTQDRLGGFAIARRTKTLLHSIIVDRKPGRVDSEFDEVADDDVLFQNGMWNLEVVWVFSVHFDAVDQFVAIGKSLLGKLLFESVVHLQSSSPTSPSYFSNTDLTCGTNAATNA